MTIAVLDACVLYSAALRDLFMHLAVQFVFQPKWTDQIHDEWITNVLLKRPELDRGPFERTRHLMNQWARDWEAPGYEALVPTLALPDRDDRHVLAAAIAGHASRIVTFNLADFPDPTLAAYGVRAQHPGQFDCDLMDEALDSCLRAIRMHRESLRNPPKTVDDYFLTLTVRGLHDTVGRLRAHAHMI